MNYFVIKAKLPSLNEYINECRRNKYGANQYKQNIENLIGWAIKQAMIKGTLTPKKKPCLVEFNWFERTAKRDCDNIASAKKYILDAMQKQGIIVNDNQKYIKGFRDSFNKADKDYVIVTLYECE